MSEHPPAIPAAAHAGEFSETIYYRVFAGLIALLVLTVVAAALDLGAWNVSVALAIATGKAALVMVYFMHLRTTTWLVRIWAMAGAAWLVILFTLTLSDYLTRAVPPPPPSPVLIQGE